jgi:hypothetical protein
MSLWRRFAAGCPVPVGDHVLRYVRKRYVDLDGQIEAEAFLSRSEEEMKKNGPSVNWMEFYSGDTTHQIAEIRKVRRMKYEKRGRVAKLHVGHTKQYLRENGELLIDCIYDPLPKIESGDAKDRKPCDQSHAYIKGVPVKDTPEAAAVRDLFVHCVIESFPVIPD